MILTFYEIAPLSYDGLWFCADVIVVAPYHGFSWSWMMAEPKALWKLRAAVLISLFFFSSDFKMNYHIVNGPRLSLWNSLPTNMRQAKSLDIFKGRLKTHLFYKCFCLYFACILSVLLFVCICIYTCFLFSAVMFARALYKCCVV